MRRSLPPRVRGLRSALVLAIALLVCPAEGVSQSQPAAGQPPAASRGSLVGYVIDVVGRPMEQVDVYLAGTDRIERTNARGYFRFTDAPTGARVIVARQIGYMPTQREIEIGSAVNDTLALLLRRYPRTLSTVEVRAQTSRAEAEAQVTAERLTQLRVGSGRLYTRDQILQARPYSIAELVQGVPGVILERGRGESQGAVVARSTRSGVGALTVEGQACELQFFLNTTPIDNETVAQLNPLDFRSVEVYPQTVLLPGLPQRPGKCGAIVINMMRISR
jgi:hypothetical protein